MKGRPRFALAACASAAVLVALPARSEPCGVPDVDATYPPDGAAGVPPNARLSAHYSSPADYAGEPVTLTASTHGEQALDVTYDEAEGLLRAVPFAALPVDSYRLAWPSLRGASSGSGRSKEIGFTVGGPDDVSPPAFAGLLSLSWDLSRDTDPCTDELEDRYLFDFELGQAEDDVSTNLLSVVLFETEDPQYGASSTPKQLGIYPFPANAKLHVARSASHAGKTCFAAVTRDLADHVSGGGNVEVCQETIESPWFEGCSVSRRAPASSAPFVLLGLAVFGRRLRRGARAGAAARP